MAHRPSRGTDSAKPNRPDLAMPEKLDGYSVSHVQTGTKPQLPIKSAPEFAELAARFVAHGGGKISPELSRELALDLVLNEIVEQACFATGACGAAIAWRRGGAMFCRASSGTNAPELGTRLNTNSGLSGACVRSGKIQSCEDAWNDARADVDLSRQLGVRSIVVYPLLSNEEFIGILEILSPLPAAFGEQDMHTLDVLASRIVQNADAAREAALVLTVPDTTNGPAEKTSIQGEVPANGEKVGAQSSPAMQNQIESARSCPPESSSEPEVYARNFRPKRFDWLTAVLSTILFAVAVLMAAVLAVRMGLIESEGRGERRSTGNVPTVARTAASKQTNSATTDVPSETVAVAQSKDSPPNSRPIADKRDIPSTAESTLFVYEGGKEIFRMPATGNRPAEPATLELISRVEPEYPAEALAQYIQGAVALDVRIGADGKVQEVKVKSGDPLLAQAAVAAVRQWRFKPYIVKGQPADAETKITLKFTLPAS